MMIAIKICIALVLVILGYIGVCWYLKTDKSTGVHLSDFSFTTCRIVYLLVCVFVGTTVVILQTHNASYSFISDIKNMLVIMLLLPCAAVDFRVQRIPNVFLGVGCLLRLIILGVEWMHTPEEILTIAKDGVFAALLFGGFFLLISLVFRNSIGMGDIKLFAVMGFYMGIMDTFSAIFYTLFVTFILSVFLLITKKKSRQDTISFGPTILIGTVLSICQLYI